MDDIQSRLPQIGDGSGVSHDERLFREELRLALRNREMPLEGLRYPITPTGMHYLLTHFDIVAVDPSRWRLKIGGKVSRPFELSLSDIRSRPAVRMPVTLECAGNGRSLLNPRPISQPWTTNAVSTADWTGTPLKGVLEQAGIAEDAVEILFAGLDQGVQGGEIQYYQRSLTVEEASREEVLLAYQMNGEPLPPQHGFPLRLIVPGWYGMASVKWLDRIEAVGEAFRGHQMHAYSYRQSADDPGTHVNRQRVRALMIPPGIPDFITRTRFLQPGPVTITGRAWAGRREVTRVEFSSDGGDSWHDATIEIPVSPHAWRAWSCQWDATPGQHTLCVRATDEAGNTQPAEPPWNYQGLGNNAVQRVVVQI